MRILCSTFGSSGDVFPMLGLAVQLRERGHDVSFMTSAHYADVVARQHLPFEPLGDEDDFQACVRDPDLWHPRRAFGHIFDTIRPVFEQQYEAHAALVQRGDAAAVTNCLGFGAFNARDRFGLPVVTLHLQPANLWSDLVPPTLPGLCGPRWLQSAGMRLAERFILDRKVLPFLNPWRKELGLPPVSKMLRWWNSPSGVLCLFPEWFAQPQRDWPAPLRQSDFPLWNDRSDEELPEKVAAFLDAGEPPVVFTPGSANVHGRSFFESAVAACRGLNRRGVLLTQFPEQLPQNLPDSIAAFDYVPLDRLLPRAAAFVHHGGIGSTSQAFAGGIPQVAVPLAHDQFDNGARIAKLGVGVALPASRLTAGRLTAALRSLLASPAVAEACREVASRFVVRDGLPQAAEAFERMLATRR